MKPSKIGVFLLLLVAATRLQAFDFGMDWFDQQETAPANQTSFYKPQRTADIPSIRNERLLARSPGNHDAHMDAARAYLNSGSSIASKRRAAMAHVDEVLKAYPGDVEALLLGAQIQNLDGRYDIAANYYRSAIAANGNDPRSWLGLGDALSRLGDASGADLAFQKFRELSAPGNR